MSLRKLQELRSRVRERHTSRRQAGSSRGRSRLLAMEALERRALLSVSAPGDEPWTPLVSASEEPGTSTAEIRGTKWEDRNGDGQRDPDEPPLPGVTVYLDLNRNGVLDQTAPDEWEPSTTTDSQGNYVLQAVAPGDYLVREVLPDGYRQTSPGAAAGSYVGYAYVPGTSLMQLVQIDAGSGQVTRVGNPSLPPLHGIVQTNSGEIFGINGSDRDRLYSVNPDTGVLTLVGEAGYEVVWGLTYDPDTDTIYGLVQTADGPINSLAIIDRQTGRATPVGTGIPGLTSTSGLAFDTNRREIVAFDNWDDEFYAFDTSGNGRLLWDTTGIESWSLAFDGEHFVMQMLGLNNDTVLRKFDPYAQRVVGDVLVSEPVPLEALEYIPAVDYAHRVTLNRGDVAVGVDFGNQSVFAEIRGTKWEDRNGDGQRDADEGPLAGVTIYLDLNRNGVLDQTASGEWEPSTTTDSQGNYVLQAVAPGDYLVREVLPDGYRQTSPGAEAAAYVGYAYVPGTSLMQLVQIDAGSGQVTRIGNPSPQRLHGIVHTNSGEIFGLDGSNIDGLYSVDPDTGDLTRVGDVGYQAVWGLTYDPDTDTIYGLVQTAPGPINSLAIIDRHTGRARPVGNGIPGLTGTTGLAFDTNRREIVAFDNWDDEFYAFDTSGNGRLLGRIPGIHSSSLAFDGEYFVMQMLGLNSDTVLRRLDPYTQRVVGELRLPEPVPLEALEYIPATDYAHRVSLKPGDVAVGVDFGNQSVIAEIHGAKWEDRNGDGQRDPDEPPLAGVTIYLDLNRNGVLDQTASGEWEPSTTTDSQGNYVLQAVAPGEYLVREVLPDGYRQTSPGPAAASYLGYAYAPGGLMQLVQIDAGSGQVTRIGDPSPQRVHGIVQTNSGEIFGLDGSNIDGLYSVDPDTGDLTRVGDVGYQAVWGLTYDPDTDTIYGLVQTASGPINSLAIIDRQTGRATPVGTGIPGLTGTSGLAFDTNRREIVAFDNSDDEFYAFDTSGNGRLLWRTSAVDSWSLAFDGEYFVMQMLGLNNNTVLRKFDPYAQRVVGDVLVSEPVPLEALEYIPAADYAHRVSLNPGDVAVGLDFGNQSVFTEIHGTKWEDRNGDGQRDADEGPLAGVTIYLDLNRNGVLDQTAPGEWEPSTTTDSNGDYAFLNLPPGEYVVREVVPDGYRQTAPGDARGFFYAIDDLDRDRLMKIDAVTGEVTEVGPFGTGRDLHGLAWTNSGELYAVSGVGSGNDYFYSIDPATGAGTLIGQTGRDVGFGLAYDAVTDTIYGIGWTGNANGLVRYDRHTGAATPIGNGVPGLQSTSAVAFDPVAGRIIVFDNADDEFYAFDTAGNGRLLSQAAEPLQSFGMSYVGSTLVMARAYDGFGDRLLAVDPDLGTWTIHLVTSEVVAVDGLEYVAAEAHAHVIRLDPGEVKRGADFGNQPVNRPPLADAGGPYRLEEGSPLTLDGSASSDPDQDPLVYAWDLDGDGEYDDASGVSPTLPWSDLVRLGLGDDGEYWVRLRVTDERGASDTAEAAVVVLNAPPVLSAVVSSATFDFPAAEGQPVTISATFTDPGTLDTHTAMVDWGDGSPREPASVDQAAGEITASHVYDRGGVYTVTLILVDDDGGQDLQTTRAVVSGAGLHDGVLQVVGTRDADEVHVNAQANRWLRVQADFFPEGSFRRFEAADVQYIQMWLGAGDDRVTIANNIAIPVTLDGGEGDDHLLPGGGPAIVIGGMGADRLIGGSGQNILIAGTSAYDRHDAALLALAREWSRDEDYSTRVARLRAGISLEDGTLVKLEKDTTVFDDNGRDQLTGTANLDWFFLDLDLDRATDWKPGEARN